MKKLYALPLALICAFPAQAGVWDLFPLGQRSYFADLSQTPVAVDLSLMDSIRPDGADTKLYFKKKLGLEIIGECPSELIQQLPWLGNSFMIDSLVERDDTVIFASQFSVTPFYFLPKAAVGQSWMVTSTYSYNTYDQITITCTGIEQRTFLGVTDSVKTFALAANGTAAGQTPISEFQIALSKEHGLIEFIPFAQFLYHPAYTDFRSFKLISIESAGIIQGYRQPDFQDYFHLSAGDVLVWRSINDPDDPVQPSTITYQRDSITSSEITQDSVTYTSDGFYLNVDNSVTQYTGALKHYYRSDLAKFLNAAPNSRVLGTGPYFSGPDNMVWGTGQLHLSPATNGIDTITSFAFGTDASTLDTTDCTFHSSWDLGFGWSFDTRAGLNEYCTYFFGVNCTTLIASQIGGEQIGDIALSINRSDASEQSPWVYPNPATDRVFLRDEVLTSGATYAIYDGLGHQVKSGEISERGIQVQLLPKGLYVMHIIQGGRTIAARFVKD